MMNEASAVLTPEELLTLELDLTARQPDPLQAAWVDFLQRFSMQWFCTMTFRESVHPESADKKWRLWCSKLNRSLYGPRWHKFKDAGFFWIRALEWQRREVIHYHALVGDLHDLNGIDARRLDWMDEWYRIAGIARIEPISSDVAVSNYVSKYVAKGGEIDLSESMRSYVRAHALTFPGFVRSRPVAE